MTSLPDKAYLAAFSFLPKLGPARWKKLEKAFESAKNAWQADLPAIIESGIEESIAVEWFTVKPTIIPEEKWSALSEEKINIISWNEAEYPERLKEIHNAPPWLYYKGNIENLKHELSIAVVGTRKCSTYGSRVTVDITRDLVANGITVVSGLALGIDAYAHKTAVDSNVATVGVLASGLDTENIYPSSNRYLAKRITETGGVLISEYACGTPALRHQFPYRNRIISGLTLGSLIIEAPKESGALITARYALEQNREVFAVPGDIYQTNSCGTNNLIKMGARPVTNAQDILDSLNITKAIETTALHKILPASSEEALILEHLNDQPIHIDELSSSSGLPAPTLNATLTIMEMSGKVRNLGGMNYVRGR